MDNDSKVKNPSKRGLIIGVVVVLVLCCAGALWYFTMQSSKTYAVSLVVNAEGLDTEKGTKIPIHAVGQDVKGNEVDSMFYGGTNASNIELKPGEYNLAIVASPIAEDGTIYNTDDVMTKVTIAKNGETTVESELTITPIPGEEVTDEQIEAAYNSAKDSGMDTGKLDELKANAQHRRDEAITAKEEALKAQEAAIKAENGGHSFLSDYFYVDVPSDWTADDWSVEQIDANTWRFSQSYNNNPGAADVVVASENPWPNSNGYSAGTTGTGLNVYVLEAAAGFFTRGPVLGLTQTWNPDDPNSIRADGISNSDYQDIANAREWLKEQHGVTY